jgi:ribose transport system ATP-binding protein/rhamnose transport system ATP-binding protein
MATNAKLLADLARETGGAAFWALLDGGRVFCLNRVGGEAAAEPGFSAGATPLFEDTCIPIALSSPPGTFVAEPDGELRTLLVQVKSHRGHGLGWIGLTVPRGAAPDAAAIGRRVHDVFTHGI